MVTIAPAIDRWHGTEATVSRGWKISGRSHNDEFVEPLGRKTLRDRTNHGSRGRTDRHLAPNTSGATSRRSVLGAAAALR